tara:strand:+ start:41 stop:691 length:651 start_codon:yes stop_codon:yes gene_type:complete
MIEKIKKTLVKNKFLYKLLRFFYIKIQQLPSRFLWFKLSKNETIKLELGSGSKKGKNGFITVDRFGADINYDLRKGIPLKDNTVDYIYTSHMLEHIPFNELISFIQECKRVLKKNGVFSVCVPNAGLYLEAYNNKTQFKKQESMHQVAIVNTGSLMDQVNYEAYMNGEHCYMFDKENLVNTLKKGGFENANLRSFDESLDMKERDYESIYALAQKV